jgi:hypothetical protein
MQWGERWQWRQSHRPRELTQRSYGEARDIGLQSRCSILLGSPPLWLCQATALFQTHTEQDTCPSTVLATPCWNTRPLPMPPDSWPPESLPPVCTGPQPGAGTTACQDTRSSPKPTALQTLLSPSHAWDDQNPPHPSGLAWLNLCVEQLEPCPAETGTIWCETATPTSLPGTPLPVQSGPQLYRLPR